MSYQLRFFISTILIACIVHLGNSSPAEQVAPSPKKLTSLIKFQPERYILGSGDRLKFDVLHEPEYSQKELLVRPDGYATFPGVGDIYVLGATVDEVASQIRESLKRTIVAPEVHLMLTDTRPSIVYLSGAVMHPGMFEFTTNAQDRALNTQTKGNLVRTDMRLTNILANAGGIALDADLSDIQINRADSGSVINVNLWKLLNDGSVAEDVWINSGDHIKIGRSSRPLTDEEYKLLVSSSLSPGNFPVRILGEVKAPGVYQLDSTSPYLNSVLSFAGGFAPQANRRVVAIRRFYSESTFQTFYPRINTTDIMLRPNDIVYISENKMYKAGRFFQQAQLILSPFTSTAMSGGSAAQLFGLGAWRNWSKK